MHLHHFHHAGLQLGALSVASLPVVSLCGLVLATWIRDRRQNV